MDDALPPKQEYTLTYVFPMPLATGHCGMCGKAIEFISVQLCDECLGPEPTCQICDEPAPCWTRGKGSMCKAHAISEWGWTDE